MRKIFGLAVVIAFGVGGVCATAIPASAQTGPPDPNADLNRGGAVIVPNTSSFYNQQGFNLPTPQRAIGQDTIRGAGGISCQSSVAGNGPTFDMGVIGTNDIFQRNSAALYGRLTIQLGKKPRRVDCTHLYDLEIERLKMELQLMRAGVVGARGLDAQGSLHEILAVAERQDAQRQRRVVRTEPVPITPTQITPTEVTSKPANPVRSQTVRVAPAPTAPTASIADGAASDALRRAKHLMSGASTAPVETVVPDPIALVSQADPMPDARPVTPGP